MPFYIDLERRKSIVREYIKAHPRATFKEIKLNLHTKINKVYSGGLAEAYRDAGIDPPRTFKIKTKEEKRKILIDYVRKNPHAGGQTIRKDTKINFLTLFDSVEDLYQKAVVPYPSERKRSFLLRRKEQRRRLIICMLKENPLLSIDKIGENVHAHPYQIFKDVKEMYAEAGLPYLGKGAKRRLTKQKEVIDFIKENNFATQREINRACRTQVQTIFSKGIFEAYQKAGVRFPYERLSLHGAALSNVKEEAVLFEDQIARKLSCYGLVRKLVRTRTGIADLILERKNEKVVIEVKNYKIHEISISQIKQLNRYLEDMGCRFGFLICLRKPKKHTFLMGKNQIVVLDDSELNRIPQILDGSIG